MRRTAGIIGILLVATSAQALAQTPEDLVTAVWTVDGGHRAFGPLAMLETESNFQQDRFGVGMEIRQMLSPSVALTLRGYLITPPVAEQSNEINAAMGLEFIPLRLGRFALGVAGHAGAANVGAGEDERVFFEYGAQGELFVALTKYSAIGLSGGRSWVETLEPRWQFMARLFFY